MQSLNHKYYGQHELDIYIHHNFICTPFIDGTFLEIGALDGIRFSNTKFFEDSMGFSKGILIEPEPDTFKQLVKNRPNCQCFNVAIHSVLEEVIFLKSKENAVGCIEEIATPEFKHRWHQQSEKLKLPATTLASILKQAKLKYIDFFSLDVEGAEFECLKSINWDMPIGLMCIEMNQDIKEINTILQKNNFKLVGSHRRNNIYFNENYFRKEFFVKL